MALGRAKEGETYSCRGSMLPALIAFAASATPPCVHDSSWLSRVQPRCQRRIQWSAAIAQLRTSLSSKLVRGAAVSETRSRSHFSLLLSRRIGMTRPAPNIHMVGRRIHFSRMAKSARHGDQPGSHRRYSPTECSPPDDDGPGTALDPQGCRLAPLWGWRISSVIGFKFRLQ
jgi:hypothetical protein